MDTLAKPVRMNPDMVKLLDKMRSDDQPYPVYQQPPEEADSRVCAVGQSLVTDANLAFANRNQYMWYVRELARLFRTRYGRDLAFHLELVMRKWQSLGLSPNIMQVIACEVHNNLRPGDAVVPTFGSPSPTPKSKTAKNATRRKSEARNPNDESSPQAGKDEGQRPKDKAKGKAESETRGPNDESRTANGEERTENSAAEAVP